MKIGASNLLIVNPRDIPGLIKEMSKAPVSAFTGVNTLFNALLNNPDFAKLDFAPAPDAGGGMAVQRSVADRWRAVTGRSLAQAYGLTETSPAVTINPLDVKEFTGSIGLPVPSTDISIRDDEGRELPIGERGEICVRGPQVTRGYWKRPDETALVLYADGFLRTGDRLRGRSRLCSWWTAKGHDPGVRLQRLSERSRGCGRAAPRRARGGGGGRAGRTLRRGGQALRHPQGSEPGRRDADRPLPHPAHRLQGAALRGVPRGPAAHQRGQDPAARTRRKPRRRPRPRHPPRPDPPGGPATPARF